MTKSAYIKDSGYFAPLQLLRNIFSLNILYVCTIWTLTNFSTSSLNANIIFSPEYGANGILKFQHIDQNKNVDFEQLWQFCIQEDNIGRWKMELHTQLPIANLPLRANEFLSYDGTNIYSILYSPDKVITSVNGPAKLVKGDDSHPARVSAGPYPIDYTSVGGILWIAFVGGEYLNISSNKMRFPDLTAANPRQDPISWVCDFEYSLIKTGVHASVKNGRYIINSKYVPENSRYISQIDDPENDNKYELREEMLKQIRDTSSEILVRSIFQVEETKFFNGFNIPVKFYCDVFPLDHSTAHNHIEISVTNLTQFLPSQLLPELSGLVTVEDRRLRIKTPDSFRRSVSYNLASDGWIIDTNDARIRASASRHPPSRTIITTRRPVYFGWAVVFFVTVFIFPIIALCWKRSATSSINK